MDRKHPAPSWPTDNYGIYHESKNENQVIAKIKFLGLYLSKHKDGMHMLICPFHCNGDNNVAFYYESSDRNPYGWYSCHKCSVCRQTPVPFYEKIGVSFSEIVNKSLIRLDKGLLSEILTVLEYELERCDDIFQRRGKLVRISVDTNTEQIIITELLPEDIRRILSKRCKFMILSSSEDKWELRNLPADYCNNIYKTQRQLKFKEVIGIAIQPYLRQDGSLATTPGYDQDTKIFSHFPENAYSIPAEPTQEDAKNALQCILDLFNEFPFASDDDKSAAVSACMTSTIRVSLPYAPMYHCNAPQSSSGKTLLMKCIAAFNTPFPVASLEFPHNNEECGKKMLALLKKGTSVIFFDNANSNLPAYPSLCSILTDEYFSDRILGQSEISEVSTRALFLSNGNNVVPLKDLRRRVIEFVILPTCENPATRTFSKEPLLEVSTYRTYYVSLVLTMIRAWIVAGCPEVDVPTIATYKDWSNWCRQVLLWLGLPDPATSLFRALDDDPDRLILRRFLHAWFDSFKSQSVRLRDAIEKGNTALKEVLTEINDGGKILNHRSLGKWLSRNTRRTVDGLTLEKDDSISLSAGSWRVISR